jgi:lipopolysaccharide transport system ATP-binding protein
MTKAEIRKKFDEIVAFAEIEQFLDTPVKRYSSGMYVRLAFAVAAHLEPEILVVDEVLAVGDTSFQKKCLGKMGEVAQSGRTVLFVSHNMAAIESLCRSGMLLERGFLKEYDCAATVVRSYLNSGCSESHADLKSYPGVRSGTGRIRFTTFHVEDSSGALLESVQSGMDVGLVFGYESDAPGNSTNVDVGLSFHSQYDQTLTVLYSSYTGITFSDLPARGSFRCQIRHLPLPAGRYKVGARIVVNLEESDWPRDGVGYLNVEHGDFYGTGNIGFSSSTPFLLNGAWQANSTP